MVYTFDKMISPNLEITKDLIEVGSWYKRAYPTALKHGEWRIRIKIYLVAIFIYGE